MNDIICDSINKYKENKLYKEFSGLIQVYPALNEFYHVSTMFDDCINDIMKKINQIDINYYYTGWNLNKVEKRCENLNNETIHIPIYIRKIYNKNSNNALSILDKKESQNTIKITINEYYIRNNYACDLKHEFIHALQMYIGNKNTIEKQISEINVDEDNDIIDKLHLTQSYINLINGFLYYSLQSEQIAQINATISYLNKNNYKITTNEKMLDNIIKLIDDSSDYNCFYKFKYYYDIIQKWWMSYDLSIYKNILVFGYFYKKYVGDKNSYKIHISKKDILNISKISDEDIEKYSREIYDVISDNFEKYKKMLYDTIQVHCVEENKK